LASLRISVLMSAAGQSDDSAGRGNIRRRANSKYLLLNYLTYLGYDIFKVF